ncbi:MAG TPA: hypothetical protein VGP63_25515 [Planctomycetaceae bacterium]|jgi:hypothetical protein|nr:hypothetical protein [Planctomycetaceae bacterium]
MLFRLLQKWAFVAMAFLVLDAATDFGPPARAADPTQIAHEAAVLDRIFANWNAQHDRITSLHVRWDCRATYKKGSLDRSSTTTPLARLDRDAVFEQSGVQLWIEGDDRMRYVTTPLRKMPQAKLADRDRVVSRTIEVRDTTALYAAGPEFETGTSSPRHTRFGRIYRSGGERLLFRADLQLLLITFRLQAPSVSWQPEPWRVVDDDVLIDNIRCVKLRREIGPKPIEGGHSIGGRVETVWVSPARGDVVVRWTNEKPPLATYTGSINYKKDQTHGWIPSEWRCDCGTDQSYEIKITDYAINEKIDPAIFAFDFPVGTPVEDKTSDSYYIVEQGGSQRAISRQQYFHVSRLYPPPKDQVSAKPQVK